MKKKSVDDIRNALLSNTTYIPQSMVSVSEKEVSTVDIPPRILRQFKILAAYQKTEMQELIDEALNHYLKLKSLQLEQAVFELTKED